MWITLFELFPPKIYVVVHNLRKLVYFYKILLWAIVKKLAVFFMIAIWYYCHRVRFLDEITGFLTMCGSCRLSRYWRSCTKLKYVQQDLWYCVRHTLRYYRATNMGRVCSTKTVSESIRSELSFSSFNF